MTSCRRHRRRRRRLVRHPNSNRASPNQSQGRGSNLLSPRAAALPRSDAGSGGVKTTLSASFKTCRPYVPLGT